ncbi:MAG: methyltransferase domain-containing protein, partial [Myxococcota bacterium]
MSGRADIRKLYSLGPSTNIFSTPLPDGSIYPDHLYEHDPRPADFLRNFDRVRTKPWDECVFLDLGCNEGSSTFLLAESGARVLGIEGRGDAVKRARVIRDALSFDHVDFLCGDVLDRSLWQEVDAVYAAGILYHLSEPFEFLELVNEYCRDYVYICTHFAPSTATELRNATLAHRIKAAHRLE